ncbi:carbonic anhydrase [Thermocoleostomius sinensis]|uniref:Carbonic anhydrase n=1 Tax=Thermocoleostomius sinensis A174 TaxID=2016057 RepID=A0A9E9C711_9CYAN|nr:carbonic anhydrase [Thermocoleostomius sinensis]WAL58773.1 carbonic anhydrase [Thermocoleostomius sinensis A174]
MRKLIKGLEKFRSQYVSTHYDLLEQLSHGQKPRVLFITCADSRIDPNRLTDTELGDLFVIRNAGNIIPPYGAANGGEGATVEYAIHALGIDQIVVCGHSHCGAMKGLLQIGELEQTMPLVYDWLKHAEATRRLVVDNYQGEYSKEELLEIMVAENVLTQIENLETYPVVRAKLFRGTLKIYAWIYLIETGEVLAYDPETHAYVPPQYLLSEDVGALSGDYVDSNHLPPVACTLPWAPESEDEPKFKSPTRKQGQEQVSIVTNRTAEASRNGNRAPAAEQQAQPHSDPFSNLWLSPEQADRIYRGSR